MTTKHDLDMLDRATLSVWRAGNTIVWSIAALAVAFAVATAFYLALSSVTPSFTIELGTRGGTLVHTLLTLGPTVLSAVAIGAIIGRHVVARPFLTAGVVAIVHTVASVWVALHNIALSAPTGFFYVFAPTGGNPGGERLVMLLMLMVEVYVAGTVARRAWEKRPRALRLGS